jgi:hypothetical protein
MLGFREFLSETIGAVGRLRIINARVRQGKLQRRKYVSNAKNYKLNRKGSLVRITNAERVRRELGALKAKRKRKANMTWILFKRKIDLAKKRSLGYH